MMFCVRGGSNTLLLVSDLEWRPTLAFEVKSLGTWNDGTAWEASTACGLKQFGVCFS